MREAIRGHHQHAHRGLHQHAHRGLHQHAVLRLDAPLDGVAIRERGERIEQLHARLRGGGPLERRVDHILEHDLEVLDGVLVRREVVVPVGRLDVEDVVVERSEARDRERAVVST
jgi:hypothetical protein